MRKTNVVSIAFSLLFGFSAFCQTNLSLPQKAENVLKGNYNPTNYTPSTIINDRETVIDRIVSEVNVDTLKSYLEVLETFQTRNTGSDTVSNSVGIGATRRWIRSKFNQYSASNENRLITGYLDFDESVCGMDKHRNVYAILPGLDLSKSEIVLIEAHMDSRCENGCDVNCYAPGMDDNGSGTVLVMELARIMSQFAFDRTIVFTTVTGEEQGLKGGRAWANYIADNNIPFLACLNNDVIGGVECGQKSSPPSCSPKGDIDSLNVRIFSYSQSADTARYSMHKQLARYVNLQQIEEINPRLDIPMSINIRMREDRTGRGGDHIPFRQRGLLALRFTSQNEHGDGSGSAPDRQHTTTDILGKDTDTPPDGKIDEYYVNFNYLRRNAIMNGVNLGLLANSPHTPTWEIEEGYPRILRVLGSDTTFKNYRIGIRSMGSGTLYFDSVYTVSDQSFFEIPVLRPNTRHFISVANVQGGVESLFSEEDEYLSTSIKEHILNAIPLLLFPNPTNGEFTLSFENKMFINESGVVEVYSTTGQLVQRHQLTMKKGENQLNLDLSNLPKGNYLIKLMVNGSVKGSSKLLLTAD